MSFEGEILKYKPIITKIRIYHCTLTMISYICRENALWIAKLQDKQTSLKISATDCLLSAQMDRYDGATLLYSKNGKTRYSPQRKKRHCHYNSVTRYDDKILQIREYEGRLEGDDVRVMQQLTSTECIFLDRSCIPEEDPNTVIIWDGPYWNKHNSSVYHSMGEFPVKEINNYYLIPNLGVGGAAIKKDHGGILLDTGYII